MLSRCYIYVGLNFQLHNSVLSVVQRVGHLSYDFIIFYLLTNIKTKKHVSKILAIFSSNSERFASEFSENTNHMVHGMIFYHMVMCSWVKPLITSLFIQNQGVFFLVH